MLEYRIMLYFLSVHRSLGVTIWELFELGNQPYRHYSDRQVLSYAVKDQQLKLPKPLLKYPLADRWWVSNRFYVALLTHLINHYPELEPCIFTLLEALNFHPCLLESLLLKLFV